MGTSVSRMQSVLTLVTDMGSAQAMICAFATETGKQAIALRVRTSRLVPITPHTKTKKNMNEVQTHCPPLANQLIDLFVGNRSMSFRLSAC